jgi:phospholipid/cholesterol/gamma-HCH transport system substrate-binding protein
MRRAVRLHRRLLDDPLAFGLLILAAAAAVLYVSYNAPRGLPWKTTHRVSVAVPDAGKVSKNADVRIGGARVGQVLGSEAVPAEGDRPAHAVLDVQLRGDIAALPADSTAEVRLASVLGGKYLALVPGRAGETIPWGGELPLEQTASSVDIEDAFQIFNPEGREALQSFVAAFAGSLAGRGEALNAATGETAELLPRLERVLASMATRRSDLAGFLRGGAAAAGAFAAVEDRLGGFVAGAAGTLAALDDAGDALPAAIAALPGAARSGTGALRTMRPVLDDVATIARELDDAGDVLPESVDAVNGAMSAAVTAAPRLGTLTTPMDRAFAAVAAFADNPASTEALRLLGSEDLPTFGTSAFIGLGAILRATWDAEKHCGVVTAWQRNLSTVVSDGDHAGNWIRMSPIVAEGKDTPASEPDEELHYNAYPVTDATECEAGNEPYEHGQHLGNPEGLQRAPEAGR